MKIISKEVSLNNKTYIVEIREIDQYSFWSRNIAVAKAYAKTENINHYPLLEKLAQSKAYREMSKQEKEMLEIKSLAFNY